MTFLIKIQSTNVTGRTDHLTHDPLIHDFSAMLRLNCKSQPILSIFFQCLMPNNLSKLGSYLSFSNKGIERPLDFFHSGVKFRSNLSEVVSLVNNSNNKVIKKQFWFSCSNKGHISVFSYQADSDRY